MASRTSSSDAPASRAISWIVGDRPSSWASVLTTDPRCRCSSWTRRGTRTAQPLSRKWRLSSPTIVGVANVENSRPRPGSKRSTALSRASDATWMRSSSGSPRFEKRRARYSASGRWVATRWSRSPWSRVRAYSSKVRRSSSRSRSSKLIAGYRRSASRPPLHQSEAGLVAEAVTVVLVDDRLEDTARQLRQLRGGRRTGAGTAPVADARDGQSVTADRAGDLDGAGGSAAAEEEVAQLVDRDAQVFHLVEGEAHAACHRSRRQSGQAQEA